MSINLAHRSSLKAKRRASLNALLQSQKSLRHVLKPGASSQFKLPKKCKYLLSLLANSYFAFLLLKNETSKPMEAVNATETCSLFGSERHKDNDYIDTLQEDATSTRHHEMIQAFTSVYPLTVLIREARKGNLKESAKVLSFFGEGEIGTGTSQPSMTAADIIDIISSNYDHLKPILRSEGPQWMGLFREMDNRAKRNGEDSESITYEVLDFKAEETRLTYAIMVDRQEKNVNLIFRGSYDGTSDWSRNLQFDMTEIDAPAGFANNDQQKTSEPLQIHRGYYEYLFDNSERGEDFADQRYDEIMNRLLPILRSFPGYQLNIGGHSMGGAIATLVTFQIASSSFDKHLVPLPISCFTIGSPPVGNAAFRDAYAQLKRINLVKHVRFENDNDTVPYALNLVSKSYQYEHVGLPVRLHLCDSRRGFLRKLGCAVRKFQTPIFGHHPIEYNRRAALAYANN